MEGLIYFPALGFPQLSWLTRSLLYWEAVGVFISDTHQPDAQRFHGQTADLQNCGLVLQASHGEVHSDLKFALDAYLRLLGDDEVDRRRAAYAEGQAAVLPYEPRLWKALPPDIYELGLAGHVGEDSVSLETTTAREWSVAVAVGLAHPGSLWSRQENWGPGRWFPATDVHDLLPILLSGVDRRDERSTLILPAMLDALLPVPREQIPANVLVRFRRRYPDVLPRLRHRFAARLQEADGPEAVQAVIREAAPALAEARALLEEAGIPCLVDAAPARFLELLAESPKGQISLTRFLEEALGPTSEDETDEDETDEDGWTPGDDNKFPKPH